MKRRPNAFASLCVALPLGLLLPGCGGDSPTGSPGPDPTVPTSVTVEPGGATLVSLGDTVLLTATVKNGLGQVISAPVSWSSDGPGVATVDSEGRVVAVGNGSADVVASAGSATGVSAIAVRQQVDSVTTSGDAQGMEVGSALDSTLVVTAFDARGNPVDGGPVRFDVLSGGGSLDPASTSTDASGRAETRWTLGMAPGPQEVEATVGHEQEVTLILSAFAYPLGPVAMEAFAGDGQSELPGLPLPAPVEVLVTDSLGNGVPDVPVFFSVDGDASLESGEVVTDLDGVARVGVTLGTALGTYTVVAEVPDSLTANNTALAGSPVEFEVTAVAFTAAPVTGLLVGDTVTLSGTGFHPVPDSNAVAVDGVAAAILAGTQSSLTVEVPGFGCAPLKGRELSVSRTGNAATQSVSVTPAGALDLEVGELWAVPDEAADCLQFLPGSGEEYLVGLTATRWFDAAGTFVLTGVDSIGAGPAPLLASSEDGRGGLVELAPSDLQGESALRAQESGLLRRVSGAPVLSLAAAAGAPPVEGDILSLRVPDPGADACTNYFPVSVEVVYGGANLVVATSAALPAPGTLAHVALLEAAQRLVDGFGQFEFNLLLATLGVTDLWTVDSRILVVLVPEVGPPGVPAFASVVDQLPRSVCPSSDERHIVYVRIPANADVTQLAAALDDSPPEVAHHIAHVFQWANRIPDGENLLPSWLAEGQAETMVELIGMARTGLWGQEDISSAVLGVLPEVSDWIPQRFDRLARFMGWDGGEGKLAGAPEGCSLFGFRSASVCTPEAGPGAAWSFIRFLADQYGPTLGGESGLQQVVMNLGSGGDPLEGFESVLGKPVGELIVEWAATLYAEGRLTPAQAPGLQITRWDSESWLPGAMTLAPESHSFADFQRLGSVLGGGTAYTLIGAAGAHGPLAVAVSDGAGGRVAEALAPRLWVLRMR